MPPKRDYSFVPPSHFRPASNRDGVPRQAEQPLAAGFTAGRQPQPPHQQPRASHPAQRPPPQVGQPPRLLRRNQDLEVSLPASRSGFYHGSTSAAAEGSQAVEDDGFIVPKKKKKKSKSKAARKKQQVSYREKKQEMASAARTGSDGEGLRGLEADLSASESDRGSRSLSPSLRLGLGFGPLAMVLRDDNMFGALEDPPSDEDAPDTDEHQDPMMVDDSFRRIRSSEPVIQCIGPGRTSPPPEGTPKRARLLASGTY